jgi:hypothetical protein
VRLSKLTKDFHTLDDVIAALGEPDIDQPTGMIVTTPERDGKPGTTKAYRMMIYTRLSDVAEVHVLVYAKDNLAIHFQGKEVNPKVKP